MSDKPKRQRRSYSCGPCKGLKVKCDMQLPCATCIKFHRVKKCHELPPNPPSEAELSKINQRKLVYMNRKRKREEVEIMSHASNHYSNAQQMHQLHHLQHIPIQEPMLMAPHMRDSLSLPIPYNAYQIQLPRHPMIHPGVSHQIDLQRLHRHQLQHSHLQPPQPQLPILTQPLNPLATTVPSVIPQEIAISPAHAHPSQPIVPMGHQFAQQYTTQIARSTSMPPTVQNPVSTSPPSSVFTPSTESLVTDDDLREIKLYLPRNINYFNSLMDRFSGMASDDCSDSHSTHSKARNIYLQVTDPKNPSFTAQNWTVDNLRIMSKLFLVLVNGLNMSPESYYNSGFLKVNLHSNEATINKWLQLSRKLRDKSIIASLDYASPNDPEETRTANIKNARFILEWYLLLKSYFHHANRMHDNFEEFIRSINSIQENEYAMEFLNAQNFNEKYVLGSNSLDYDSKYLAVGWLKMRLVEVEFPFLQINGSLFLSPKFCNTILPSEQFLKVIFQRLISDITTCSFYEFQTNIWKIYHRNNLHSKERYSVGMLEAYMLCFKDLNLLIKDFKDVKSVSQYLLEVNEKNLLKTYAAQWVFSRGTLLMKLANHTYFPLLRVASYLTTQLNKFNFLLYLDLKQKLEKFDVGFIDSYMIHLECRCYNMSILLIELINLLIYLATLFNYLRLSNNNNDKRRFQLLLALATMTYDRFQRTLELVKESKLQSLKHVSFYSVCISMIDIIDEYIRIVNEVGPFAPSGFQEPESKAIMFDAYFGSKSESVANDLLKYLRTHCSSKEDWQCFIVSIFGTADTLSTQIEQLWEAFTFITERTPNGDIEIVEGLTLDVDLVDKICNNFTGLEFDENIIKDFISSLTDEKNIVQQHSPFTFTFATTLRSAVLGSPQVPNEYGMNHQFLAIAAPK